MSEPATSSSRSLRMRDVGISLGGNRILDGLDFSLHPGELCALIGPSGAGKSTLIRLLLGLREPDDGEVTIAGKAATVADPVAYVPQEDALHRTLTTRAALDYTTQLRLPTLDGAGRQKLIEKIARQVGLGERLDLRISSLSGGQRKRVAIALELVSQPLVMILDEPTSGLDPGMEAQMMALFATIAGSGRIVLVSTHSMQSLDLCQSVLVLMRGRVVYFGPPELALRYFAVERFEDIFPRLTEHAPEFWQRRYNSNPLREAFARRSAPKVARREPEAKTAPTTATLPPSAPPTSPPASGSAILERLKKERQSIHR